MDNKEEVKSMNWKGLLQDIAKTGPDNVKRLMEVAEHLPHDSTLQDLNTTLNNLIPFIPQLEKVLGNGNIKNLERLVKKIPDAKTLDRLSNALPMLEKLPDKQTLNQLLDKADSLKSFLDSLEKEG